MCRHERHMNRKSRGVQPFDTPNVEVSMSPEPPTAAVPAKRDRTRRPPQLSQAERARREGLAPWERIASLPEGAERHDTRVVMLVFVVCLVGIASIAADYFLLESAAILQARFMLDATVLSEGFLVWVIPGALCYLLVVYPYVVVGRQSLRCYTDGIYLCRWRPARCWDCKVLDKLGLRPPRTALNEEPR